ncbi:MAG: DUF983 domain-containing protein, partial [Hyphomicrobium sp.]
MRGHWSLDADVLSREDYGPMGIASSSSVQGMKHERSVPQSLKRGAAQMCPACGNGALYTRYLKVADQCPACSEVLHHHRADDAPPYFTILIVGHFVVAGVMMVEDYFRPNYWVHALMWVPLTIGLTLLLLPRIKGALVGLQWALKMHGFGA